MKNDEELVARLREELLTDPKIVVLFRLLSQRDPQLARLLAEVIDVTYRRGLSDAREA